MGRFDCIYFVWSRRLFLIYDTNTKNVLRLFLIFTGILQQDEKEKKRPGSRGSAKSKASQEKEAEPAQKSTPVQEEFWPVSTPIPVTLYIFTCSTVNPVNPGDQLLCRTRKVFTG